MWVDSGMIIIPYDNIGKSFLYKISECHLPTPCLCQLRLRPGSDPDSFASCTSGKLWAIRFCAKSHLYLNNGWQNLNSKSDPMGEPVFSSTEITKERADFRNPSAQLSGPKEAKVAGAWEEAPPFP